MVTVVLLALAALNQAAEEDPSPVADSDNDSAIDESRSTPPLSPYEQSPFGRSPFGRSPLGRSPYGAETPTLAPFSSIAQPGDSLRPQFGDFMWGGALAVFVPGGELESDIPVAGGTRVFKVAENGSPLPGDRAYLMYCFYNNAYLASRFSTLTDDTRGLTRTADAHRFALGMERTLFSGKASLEARLPFGRSSPSLLAESDSELGNLGLAAKVLLVERPGFGLSTGLQTSLPTMADVRGQISGTPFVIRNHSVHLGPFIGFYVEDESRCLVASCIAQWDFDLNGNAIETSSLQGTLQDQSLVFVDLSLGRWIYRNADACNITGLLSVIELHYTSTLNDADIVGDGSHLIFTSRANNLHILDLTLALHIETRRFDIRAGVAFPVSDDKPFDAEAGIQINYWRDPPVRRRMP
jgi:hypothetical protein